MSNPVDDLINETMKGAGAFDAALRPLMTKVIKNAVALGKRLENDRILKMLDAAQRERPVAIGKKEAEPLPQSEPIVTVNVKPETMELLVEAGVVKPPPKAVTIAPQAVTTVLVDCSTLQALTEKQAKVWRTMRRLEATSTRVTAYDIRRAASYPNVDDALSTLAKKGYVECIESNIEKRSWRSIATGDPVIDNSKLSRAMSNSARLAPAWTTEQDEALEALAPALGDTYTKFGEQIGRSARACIQRAYTRNVYLPALDDTRASWKPPAVQTPQPESTSSVPPKAPIQVKRIARNGLDADLRDRGQSMTAELMGDPTRKSDDLDVKNYLLRKGHSVWILHGAYIVDGKRQEAETTLALVNHYRSKAELPALTALPPIAA